MAKKKETILSISSVENTLLHKPRYNPYAVGHGAYKNKKHPSRGKIKNDTRRQVNEEL